MYALQDYIGEDNLNVAFQNFLDSMDMREDVPFAISKYWYKLLQ